MSKNGEFLFIFRTVLVQVAPSMDNPTVTFETKCYENDWEYLLKRGYLQAMIENCNYSFAEKFLCINNVKNIADVRRAADKMVSKNVINGYIVVDDHADEILNVFEITRESLGGGYYYSIAELAAIYHCRTDYLLHLSGDSIIKRSKFNWIDRAINMMTNSAAILVANPTWNNMYYNARKESFREDDEWFYGYGFSDQCYLIKTERFRGKIYNENNVASERYPVYGGGLFEKRIDSYMRNKGLLRITSKHISYLHKNFPKTRIRKKLIFLYDFRYKWHL